MNLGRLHSVGAQPDTPVADAYRTPWILLGPVLPGEHPAPTPTLKAGTYPQRSATRADAGGERVMLGSIGHQAKWWTEGELPGAAVPTSLGSSPWQGITLR